MNLFPFKNSSDIGSDELPIFIEFAWDYENDCHVVEDGELKKVTGLEAVRVWAYKALRIQRYRYLSFSWQYGSEIEELIGQVMSNDQMKKEIEKRVGDALLVSPYIFNVKDFEVDSSDDVPSVSFKIVSVYGEVELSV